jgi:hypothetical protein
VIRTPFSELVGVEHPVVCAGMGGRPEAVEALTAELRKLL